MKFFLIDMIVLFKFYKNFNRFLKMNLEPFRNHPQLLSPALTFVILLWIHQSTNQSINQYSRYDISQATNLNMQSNCLYCFVTQFKLHFAPLPSGRKFNLVVLQYTQWLNILLPVLFLKVKISFIHSFSFNYFILLEPFKPFKYPCNHLCSLMPLLIWSLIACFFSRQLVGNKEWAFSTQT